MNNEFVKVLNEPKAVLLHAVMHIWISLDFQSILYSKWHGLY